MKPVLWDKQAEVYIRSYDPKVKCSAILNLWNKPNFNSTSSLFERSLANSLLVTGDTYVIIGGLNEPVEIFYENSKFVTIVAGSDGYPYRYHVSKSHGTEIYTREEINGQHRFYSNDKLRELIQIKDFNPDFQQGIFYGFSRLSPVYYELEQYIQANVHNWSQLKKGARPSGALFYDGELTTEQREVVRAELRRFYQGAENASELMILEGGGAKKEFKELSINNKDMDYKNMKKMVKDSIYENLEIPASFYDNSKSTMNNKDTDKMNIYDFCVIPITKQIYEGVGELCLRRYKDGERYELTFIEEEIPALRERYSGIMKDKRDSGAFTINEIRELYGKESIGEAGDTVYQPMNLIAIGSDKYTQDNLNKPIKKSIDIEFVVKELEARGISEEHIKEMIEWHS
jgi:HK97 family phage portal protein